MPVITYVAKRELEKIDYRVEGSDISVAALDDSFNSVATDLSGLAAGDWIEVTGFADPLNNGFFEIDAPSTATKITQGTTTDLVDEAAGTDVVIQGYKRGLGGTYSFEFDAQVLQPDAMTTRHDHKALGGAMESLRDRHERFWDVTITPVHRSELKRWREIIHSVDAREAFTFDPYGTVASPDEPLQCDLESDSYREQRQGSSQFFDIQFRVREVP